MEETWWGKWQTFDRSGTALGAHQMKSGRSKDWPRERGGRGGSPPVQKCLPAHFLCMCAYIQGKLSSVRPVPGGLGWWPWRAGYCMLVALARRGLLARRAGRWTRGHESTLPHLAHCCSSKKIIWGRPINFIGGTLYRLCFTFPFPALCGLRHMAR